VDDAHGFARGGHVVEPAARGQTLVVELEDAVGEGVAAAEVVEEPAVEAGLFERGLDVADARGLRLARRLLVVLRARVGGEKDEQEEEGGGRRVEKFSHGV
jgi:hypothetical protein